MKKHIPLYLLLSASISCFAMEKLPQSSPTVEKLIQMTGDLGIEEWSCESTPKTSLSSSPCSSVPGSPPLSPRGLTQEEKDAFFAFNSPLHPNLTRKAFDDMMALLDIFLLNDMYSREMVGETFDYLGREAGANEMLKMEEKGAQHLAKMIKFANKRPDFLPKIDEEPEEEDPYFVVRKKKSNLTSE